jgi:SAM-dependent methyltransferase
MTATYTIDGGAAGKARLDVLSAVCAPGTDALLDRIGIRGGARCLDVGCGGGHVTRELALRVGEDGFVTGIDLDETVLELARVDTDTAGITNVEFLRGEASELPAASYDVVYARCLLSHVESPAGVVDAIAAALVPGGVAIVEDIDFRGYFCEPPLPAHDRYVDLYRETVRRRGGNADLGPALPGLLAGAGLEQIAVSVSQACAVTGESKLIPPLTLERIADAVVAEGVATLEEVTGAVRDLYAHAEDPATVMGMPRLVQAWGRKP